ncbi:MULTISPECIES: bifunctional (p)ppGpp synthetase/guanosine-3',5'-bis(diphosphate) 3'-pyrophosphohydrolase [unclassified Polaribacter]|uniref:RelA/SpoT family protein n=1 Tax=unclassified Polaribacter TaxID=196858 RepID=UPI001C4FEA73|nr:MULTISPECIES: RelA/SpoT family protein [unclassified Polaribacter]QXP62140.1 bifunctional (p)ppGpp synthetase/guanosine-3',5'-bis(diphosphate) 3'-pyrophosphohydrolase [Polaribacter sp. HaHaR_3_91]QXP67898.1 bifunctional (p)ppGpp synthetase/guanosine-3',5'-bis(diphosphate) 3'-pyrophosphohydrolase [Polaribacter sp. AHE13PA]QXP70065.1 bifunctional (p)ppGpp synthetase/guanosine-3',5'-bis(diphosphate) 3'-pyrophosphohydrolase [Polaribacter sp. R2A056_3_33]
MEYTATIEEENKEIAKRYKDLLKGTYEIMSKEDKELIRKAFDIAVDAHSDQRRKTGEPYIYHPIAVAKIVAYEIGLDAVSIASALLHDVVEDTEYTLEDMENLFGETIAKIVNGLTKISRLNKEQDASIQAENFRKMLLTLNDDVRVILIKIADRLHNMQTMDAMPAHKQVKIASETLYIYAPLAHRLGLYNIKTELEDLGLKYTEPEAYFGILGKIKESKEDQKKYLQRFEETLKSGLDKENFDYEIKGRFKSIYSIRRKMINQNVTFDEVYDKYAIRIIYNPNSNDDKFDAWKIYTIVTDYFKPNPTRLRDWISQPKSTGYEALHITVVGPDSQWVEVQIRSNRMNEIAEKGYAAHFKYKQGVTKDNGLDDWLNKLKETLETQTLNAVDFVENFKLNLYSKEIYVFTPKGDLKSLPKNATALDFAFSIHTDVGLKCRGAKVNGKLLPLSHQLKSGDQIEVITSSSNKPNARWLDFVITARAKARIRAALNEEEKLIADEGKAILIRKLRHLKITFNDKTTNELVNYFKLKTSFDLFFRIGNGAIDNTQLKAFVSQRNSKLFNFFKSKLKRNTPEKEYVETEEVSSKFDALVFGKDEQKLDYKLSKCCNPIPGDKVFGFLTINDGLKVHKMNCPNAISLQSNYAYRIMPAKWIDSTKQDFKVILHISGVDNQGLANDVTRTISGNMGVFINSINIKGDEGVFEGKISISVKNISQLDKLIKKLLKIEGVKKVDRVNTL